MSDYVLHVIIVRGCLRFGRWGLNRGTILSWHRLAKIYVIVMNESGNGAPDPRCTAIPKHCQGMLQLLAATLLLCWSTDEEQWPSTVTNTAKRQILALEERTASPPQRQPPLNCARPTSACPQLPAARIPWHRMRAPPCIAMFALFRIGIVGALKVH
jgi:hypothetical protein